MSDKLRAARLPLAAAAFFWLAAPLAASTNTAFGFIEQGDHAYAERTKETGAAEALKLYDQAMTEDPGNIQAQWKAARALYWMADHAGNAREKLKLFQEGIRRAEKTVGLEPESVEAHFWLAALYGSYGEAKGILKSLALVKPIRREMEAVIRLDDRFQGGGGYRVLGVVDYKVPGFAGGSRKRALENLNKALAIDPDNAFTRYYLAEYFETVNKRGQAVEHLDALDRLVPKVDVDRPDLELMKERGALLRKKLKR